MQHSSQHHQSLLLRHRLQVRRTVRPRTKHQERRIAAVTAASLVLVVLEVYFGMTELRARGTLRTDTLRTGAEAGVLG